MEDSSDISEGVMTADYFFLKASRENAAFMDKLVEDANGRLSDSKDAIDLDIWRQRSILEWRGERVTDKNYSGKTPYKLGRPILDSKQIKALAQVSAERQGERYETLKVQTMTTNMRADIVIIANYMKSPQGKEGNIGVATVYSTHKPINALRLKEPSDVVEEPSDVVEEGDPPPIVGKIGSGKKKKSKKKKSKKKKGGGSKNRKSKPKAKKKSKRKTKMRK